MFYSIRCRKWAVLQSPFFPHLPSLNNNHLSSEVLKEVACENSPKSPEATGAAPEKRQRTPSQCRERNAQDPVPKESPKSWFFDNRSKSFPSPHPVRYFDNSGLGLCPGEWICPGYLEIRGRQQEVNMWPQRAGADERRSRWASDRAQTSFAVSLWEFLQSVALRSRHFPPQVHASFWLLNPQAFPEERQAGDVREPGR